MNALLMGLFVALRDDQVDGLADHLGLGETEERCRGAVPRPDQALGVAGDDGVDRRLHDRAEFGLRLAKRHAHLGYGDLAFDPRQDLTGIERLDDQVVARLEPLDLGLRIVEAGHEDHRNVARLLALL